MPRAPKTTPKKPAYRPLKKIDWDEVDRMLIEGWLGTEIAPVFNMHPETFYDRFQKCKGVGFSEYCDNKRSWGAGQLRSVYFEEALNGNTQLLIKLGEQRLGYTKTNESAEETQGRVNILLLQKLEDLERRIQSSGFSQQIMANQQLVLDQGQPGQPDQVQAELGTESPVERSSSVQDNSQSPAAGNNDVFVPDFTR